MVQFEKASREVGRSIEGLLESQKDDLRLRDNLEGLQRSSVLPGLTWFWGPLLYQRNRVLFRPFIQQHFSEWDQVGARWRRVPWSKYADRLEPWLASARLHRDTSLVRRLLRWKHAGKGWGLDSARWTESLVQEYQSAAGPAARAIVLEEFDDWFDLDEATALALYEIDRRCSAFLLKHLPQHFGFFGTEKRLLWAKMFDLALNCGDEELAYTLYRRQVPLKDWQQELRRLAAQVPATERLNDELLRRHPIGWGLTLSPGVLELLERRGRDVMPYVREKIQSIVGQGYGNAAEPIANLAERKGWWDLWAAAIRANPAADLFNRAVQKLLSDVSLDEPARLERLRTLAGVSCEWNWPGVGLAQVHALEDQTAVALYSRYPHLVHGPYKAHVIPTWWRGSPLLLAAARAANDDELIDLLASRYVTKVFYPSGYLAKERDRMEQTADELADMYQSLRERDPVQFARRAANVLTRIPAYAIHHYDGLLRSNKLARLFFVRSFDAFLDVPESVRDLVEGSEVHVQMLSYRILAQSDERAERLSVSVIDILIGTLLRPLHRKTRLAAFGALANAARADAVAAATILTRARESLRLPDRKFPKEPLIGLLGQILHARPELSFERERPVIFGLERVPA